MARSPLMIDVYKRQGEMMNFDQVKAALEKRGYAVSSFETAKDAADYLDQQIDEVSVSFGGSLTLSEMGVPKRLASHNTCLLYTSIPSH